MQGISPGEVVKTFRVAEFSASSVTTCAKLFANAETFSDKFGHENCVILRDSAIREILRVAVNALIAAG